MRRRRLFRIAVIVLLGTGVVPAALSTAAAHGAVAAVAAAPAVPIAESAEIAYLNDAAHPANRCDGTTGELHYRVFYPAAPGNYPIVFGMRGTGFDGSADCSNGTELYRTNDKNMRLWAERGFVALNIEYHGTRNGLYGNATYPGTKWGKKADGTVELNIKRAVKYFFGHNPGQWGADESKGIIAFGGSSGGHNAHMLAETSPVAGHVFDAAIGYSGLPDAADGGAYPYSVYLNYMCGAATCPADVASFGEPIKRLRHASPAQYAANSTTEIIDYPGAEKFIDRCTDLGVSACWVRILAGGQHSFAYLHRPFDSDCSDGPCDLRVEPAAQGATVFDDTIAFAEQAIASASAARAGAGGNRS